MKPMGLNINVAILCMMVVMTSIATSVATSRHLRGLESIPNLPGGGAVRRFLQFVPRWLNYPVGLTGAVYGGFPEPIP